MRKSCRRRTKQLWIALEKLLAEFKDLQATSHRWRWSFQPVDKGTARVMKLDCECVESGLFWFKSKSQVSNLSNLFMIHLSSIRIYHHHHHHHHCHHHHHHHHQSSSSHIIKNFIIFFVLQISVLVLVLVDRCNCKWKLVNKRYIPVNTFSILNKLNLTKWQNSSFLFEINWNKLNYMSWIII